jgi:hypothetical protein
VGFVARMRLLDSSSRSLACEVGKWNEKIYNDSQRIVL